MTRLTVYIRKSKARPGSRRQKKDPKVSKGQTVGSKHMSSDALAQQASLKRMRKQGQQAHWKAMPGWVVEIVKADKKVDGNRPRPARTI